MAFGTPIRPVANSFTITASSNAVMFDGTSIETIIKNTSSVNKSIDVYFNDNEVGIPVLQGEALTVNAHVTDITVLASDGTSTGLTCWILGSVVE